MLKYVQNKKEDYLDFVKKLISIKSLSGQEKDVAECVLEKLKTMKLDDAFIDGAGNAVGVLRGTGEGPNVVLNGHMDCVPEGDLALWEPFDPYCAAIDGDKMIGRGTCDMKAGLAAILFSLEAIADWVDKTGKRLPGDIVLCGVVQEEPAVMFGIKYFMEHTMAEKDLKADVVYLAESSDGRVVIGQRGKIELVAKTYGKAVHSSTPHLGENALEYMGQIITSVFDHNGINLESDPYLGDTCITITNCIVKPGGTLSTIPDYCEIAIDRRYSTSMTEEDLLGEFENIFARIRKEKYPDMKATIEPRYFETTSWTGYTESVKKWHPAWRVERDNAFVEKTFDALRAIGQEPEEGYYLGGTDGSMTCAVHKVPTIIYGCTEFESCHRPKEWATVKAMVDTFDGYVSILSELYGIDRKAFD